jgi:hypothetical protein
VVSARLGRDGKFSIYLALTALLWRIGKSANCWWVCACWGGGWEDLSCGCALGTERDVAKPSVLGLDNSVDGVKPGFQTLKSTIVFPRELLDELVKLTLRSIDLLLKKIGTVLQVATDVAHQ